MKLIDIAIKNLQRRKGKAAFLLIGLTVGVSTVVATISFGEVMTHDINHKLEKYGANILVVPKTENLALTYGEFSITGISIDVEEIQETDLARMGHIKNSANIAAMGPIVLGVVTVNKKKVLLAGIKFRETAILKPWWKIDGALPDDSGVIIGSKVAEVLNIRQGDILEINSGKMKVSGLLQPTGSQDDRLIFSNLAPAQRILNKKGKVSMVEVAALCNACPIEDMVNQISEALPGARVMAIQQVVKSRMEAVNQFKKFSFGLSVVIILIGSLIVLITMMGNVRERTDEIGIFRAIGFRRSHVMKILLFEAGIISGFSGIIGYAAGLGATRLAIRFFAENHHAEIIIIPELAAASIFLAVIIGLLASAYPALLAARLDPNEALRSL